VCPGRELYCASQPPGEVGFEGALVGIAAIIVILRTSFASSFEHDGLVGVSVVSCGEEDERGFEKAFCAITPDLLFFACGLRSC